MFSSVHHDRRHGPFATLDRDYFLTTGHQSESEWPRRGSARNNLGENIFQMHSKNTYECEPVAREIFNKGHLMTFDVSGYDPEELMVKTIGDKIEISGSQQERARNGRMITSREFTRVLTIPSGVDPSEIRSTLSEDGILSLHTSKFLLEESDTESPTFSAKSSSSDLGEFLGAVAQSEDFVYIEGGNNSGDLCDETAAVQDETIADGNSTSLDFEETSIQVVARHDKDEDADSNRLETETQKVITSTLSDSEETPVPSAEDDVGEIEKIVTSADAGEPSNSCAQSALCGDGENVPDKSDSESGATCDEGYKNNSGESDTDLSKTLKSVSSDSEETPTENGTFEYQEILDNDKLIPDDNK